MHTTVSTHAEQRAPAGPSGMDKTAVAIQKNKNNSYKFIKFQMEFL